MSAQPLSAVEQRLINQARQAAGGYSAGRLSIAQVRAQMREAIAQAQTAAMLIGTGAQRNAEIDAALRDAIQAAWAELDAALSIIEDRQPDANEIVQRLEGFADTLEDTQQRGESLQQRPVSPLVPALVGGALAALLRRATAAPATATPAPRVGLATLPRSDSTLVSGLFGRLQGGVDDLAGQLARGEISLSEWAAAMRRQVIQAHTAMYRVGVNRELTPDDRQRLNDRLRQQLDYLDAWVSELSGQDAYNENAIRARARLYLNATNATLQEGRAAALGLPRLPALPGDGTTKCLTSCKCTWRIVQLDGPGNYDVYWRLRPAEHCPTCVARANAWNPIPIRGGVLGPYEPIFSNR